MAKEEYVEVKFKNVRQVGRVGKKLIKSVNALYDAGLINIEEYKSIISKIGTYLPEKVMKFKTKLKTRKVKA